MLIIFWKRDEAVVLVREGSIVIGASRYEPRLRCTSVIMCPHHDAAVHLRISCSRILVSARSGDDPSLAANVGELEAHLYSFSLVRLITCTQQHSTDASPVRSRSPSHL